MSSCLIIFIVLLLAGITLIFIHISSTDKNNAIEKKQIELDKSQQILQWKTKEDGKIIEAKSRKKIIKQWKIENIDKIEKLKSEYRIEANMIEDEILNKYSCRNSFNNIPKQLQIKIEKEIEKATQPKYNEMTDLITKLQKEINDIKYYENNIMEPDTFACTLIHLIGEDVIKHLNSEFNSLNYFSIYSSQCLLDFRVEFNNCEYVDVTDSDYRFYYTSKYKRTVYQISLNAYDDCKNNWYTISIDVEKDKIFDDIIPIQDYIINVAKSMFNKAIGSTDRSDSWYYLDFPPDSIPETGTWSREHINQLTTISKSIRMATSSLEKMMQSNLLVKEALQRMQESFSD